MIASAAKSSTTANVSRKVRIRSGARRPTRARIPSANAVSVDMAVPQPCADARPALKARKMAIGTIIPPRPASTGMVRRRRSRSSPRSNSRRASSPTTKKKKVIRPLFTQACRSCEMPAPPRRMDSWVCHTAW